MHHLLALPPPSHPSTKCNIITTNHPPYHHPTAPADNPCSAAAVHSPSRAPYNRACSPRCIPSLHSRSICRFADAEIAGCMRSPRSGSRAIRWRLLSRLRVMTSVDRSDRDLAMAWKRQHLRGWDWASAVVAFEPLLPGVWRRPL